MTPWANIAKDTWDPEKISSPSRTSGVRSAIRLGAAQVSCVYHSEEAENQFLRDPKNFEEMERKSAAQGISK